MFCPKIGLVLTPSLIFVTGLISFLGTGFVTGCGPASWSDGSPYQAGVPGSSAGLERQLASLARSTDTGTTLRRSRLLRALGQQKQALSELDAAVRAARERVDWDALASLWRTLGTVHLEFGDPGRALAAFGNRLKLSKSLGSSSVRISALVDSAYAFLLLGRVGQADHAVSEAKILAGKALARDALAQERMGLIAHAPGQQHGGCTPFWRGGQSVPPAGRSGRRGPRSDFFRPGQRSPRDRFRCPGK